MLQVGQKISKAQLLKDGWTFSCFFGYYEAYKRGVNTILWDSKTETVRNFL